MVAITSEAPGNGVTPAWAGLFDEILACAAERGAHLARTVVLLPYANLLPLAHQAWAAHCPTGFAPRMQTTRNWADDAGVFAPAADDLRFDRGRDLLIAHELLARAGQATERALLAPALVEQAMQLAPLAAAQPPAQRAQWAAQAAAVLPSAGEGPFQLEALVAQVATAWVGHSGYATDVLFDARLEQELDLLVVVPGLQPDPLAQALLERWSARAVVLPLEPETAQGRVALHAAHDAEDEAERAAACVLGHLAAGRAPVALVAADRILQRRINALLATRSVRAGEQLRDETGWTLSTTHAAASVMVALQACAPQASSDAVLDWIKLAPALAAFDHRGLERRLRRDAVRGWARAALLTRESGLTGRVQALRAPMAEPRPLSRWLGVTRVLLADCGLWRMLEADLAGCAVIDALGLDDVRQAEWAQWPPAQRRMDLTEFTHWVRDALEGASFRPPHPPQPQVVVLPLAQLFGRSFAALVLPGADEQHLSAAPEPPGNYSAAQREALGLPARDLLRQAQARAWALAIAQPVVDVLWRQTDDSGEPLLPSPFVEALRLTAAAPPPSGADARVARSVAAAPTLPPAAIGAALPTQPLSASSYERLRDCPYRFFAISQLGLRSEDELDVDIDRSDWGRWLHDTLRIFHEALQRTPDADRLTLIEDAARQATQTSGLDQEAGEFMPFEVAWPALRDAYLKWLKEHEAGGLRFEAAEKDVDVRRGALQLKGRIDRIDRTGAGTALLIDYKTEAQQKSRNRVKEGSEDTQLAFYALLLGEDAPRAAYLNLAEREEPKLFELQDVQQLAAQLHEGMEHDVQCIAQGTPLLALGAGSVCDWCEVRGLCRKDFWA